ncbi:MULTISPECIES: nitrogenase-stabilizing/protective protein NifW [Corallincola]|uniref:Nitrogenase-stabilizing/protective protein NifW n=2 Tax=Corallincola TaxID=1775176 RepID=A0A368NTH7_9GAMM|nr:MULTISPECIES: nitrogenase-stabilizing/protective protein NifW [Corallincola]RCU52521.1 hypothetical protein DU002_00700 [Corallincola holothuriorum]TAA48285.1 hypothetical protein EXY25_03370 [Corallincola spongiicola]
MTSTAAASSSPQSRLPATDLDLALAELDSAEDFLTFFQVSYQPEVIQHRRIELLRQFYQQLANTQKQTPMLGWQHYKSALNRAYCLIQKGEQVGFAASKCGDCQKCD